MNRHLEAFARDFIYLHLLKCKDAEKHLFNQMYSPNNLKATPIEVSQRMGVKKLDWAMQQIERSLDKRGINVGSYTWDIQE